MSTEIYKFIKIVTKRHHKKTFTAFRFSCQLLLMLPLKMNARRGFLELVWYCATFSCTGYT